MNDNIDFFIRLQENPDYTVRIKKVYVLIPLKGFIKKTVGYQ